MQERVFVKSIYQRGTTP